MPPTADRYTDYMYDLVDRVVKEIGPRESCSKEERELGDLFAREIEPACEKVEKETFTCSPTAFLGFFPYLVIMYVAGLVAYFFIPAVSAAIALIGLAIIFCETVRYYELTDPIFPKGTGENVAGFVAPSGEVRRRLYVSAHFDSAYEFKLWYWFKNAAGAIMGLGFFCVLLMFGFGLARTIAEPLGLPASTVYWVFGWVLVGTSPLVLLFAVFHTKDVVPGAMDDMTGIAVLAGIAKYLHDSKSEGGFYPENTEVVLLGLSSEEAGLRGAKRYAARHRGECDGLPTGGVFLDGIADEEHFNIFRREYWPGAKLDQELVEIARSVADEKGFKPRVTSLPLGATDASAFALAGIPSVAICLTETDKLTPNYHTRLDTLEYVNPRSLSTCLETVIGMIERLDSSP